MTNKKEDFLSKISRLAQKAENLIENEVEKFKESGAVDKISDYIDKTGEYVEGKIEDFKNSDIPDQVDDFVEKTEKKAGEVIKQVQVAGDKLSEKVEGAIDKMKDRSTPKDKAQEDETNKPKLI
jgi:geranylgeranyl pyrophosphate synthase